MLHGVSWSLLSRACRSWDVENSFCCFSSISLPAKLSGSADCKVLHYKWPKKPQLVRLKECVAAFSAKLETKKIIWHIGLRFLMNQCLLCDLLRQRWEVFDSSEFTQILRIICCRVVSCECIRWSQPAWRSLCQWPTSPQPHQVEDRGVGSAWDQTLRYQQTTKVTVNITNYNINRVFSIHGRYQTHQ